MTCMSMQSTCELEIQLQDDLTPEFGYSFTVRLFNPSAGTTVDDIRSAATVQVLPSDEPYGEVEFLSRYVVVGHHAEEVEVELVRRKGLSFSVSVAYETVLISSSLYLAGVKSYPASYDTDFSQATGTVTFKDGVDSQSILIPLAQDSNSDQFPKIFNISLSNPRFGAVLGLQTECTVLIVQTDNIDIWDTQVKAVTQPMSDSVIDYLLDEILDRIDAGLDEESLTVVEDVLGQILAEGEKRQLQKSALNKMFTTFCSLMEPNLTVTSGRYAIQQLFERLLFSLLAGETCEAKIDPYLQSCQHFTVSIAKLYPHNMNGYSYTSSSKHSLTISANVVSSLENQTCVQAVFIEYNNQHWFPSSAGTELLSSRALGVSLRGAGVPTPGVTSSPAVMYRVYAPDGTRTDKRAQCVYYDEEEKSWTSGNDVCRVRNQLQLGTSDFVECECNHLSSYAVTSLTRDKAFIGYPTYMFIITACCQVNR